MTVNCLIELYEYNNTTLIKKTANTSCLIYQTFNVRHKTP